MTDALAALDQENRAYREDLEERVKDRTRELQEAYDRMKAMADEKDQFVATVSHDFRSPLAVILASIQTIVADDDMPRDVRREFLAKAVRQCKRLGALVSDLLDLARIENRAAEFKRESVDALARDGVDLHQPNFETRDVRLVYVPPTSKIAADVDRAQVERALANLLGNALKFTPADGRVTVSVERDGDNAVIRVADTGPGIPADELPHVCDRFFQGERGRAAGGSGLGLAIVAEVARQHGGDVRVSSPPGRGATFELWLPLPGAEMRKPTRKDD
jgi:signal transduction histidine kinase